MTSADAVGLGMRLLGSPLGQALAALFAAWFVYWLGLRSYFAQKDYEYLQRRYLEEGLDRLSADVGQAMSVFRHNWQLTLRFLKLFRDSPEPICASDFTSAFRELDQSLLHIPAAHRVHTLVKSPLVWNGYQAAIAFVSTANETMRADFGTAFLSIARGPNHPNKGSFIKEAENMINAQSEKAEPFYVLLSVLQDLAEEAGRVRLTRRRVSHFYCRAAVRKALTALEPHFKD